MKYQLYMLKMEDMQEHVKEMRITYKLQMLGVYKII